MKRVAVITTFSILMGVLTFAPLWAGTPTQSGSITGENINQHNRTYLRSVIDREPVKKALRNRGIAPAEARLRLAKLPDEKIDRLAMRLRNAEKNDTDPLNREKQAMGQSGNSIVGAVVSVVTTIVMIPINILTALLTGF